MISMFAHCHWTNGSVQVGNCLETPIKFAHCFAWTLFGNELFAYFLVHSLMSVQLGN